MAVLTNTPTEIGSNLSPTVGVRLLAWYTDNTTTGAIAHLKLQAISQGITYTGTNKNYELNLGSVSTGTVSWSYAPLPADTWVDVAEITLNMNSGTTVNTSGKVWTYVYGDAWVFGDSVTMPTFGNPPSGLSMTFTQRGQESLGAIVSVTSWNGGTASTRYRELQVWTYSDSGLVLPRRYKSVFGNELSSEIIVNNDAGGGTLVLRGNTRYVLGVYASNGDYNTDSIRQFAVTTLPYQDTLTFNTSTLNSITFQYVVPADGGRYDKTLQYSIDGGTTWITYDTISGGSTKTSTFTISGLNPGTTYTIKSRVTTNNEAYIVDNEDLVAQTTGPSIPTVNAGNVSDTQNRITYGTSDYGGGTNPLTSLYGETSQTPTTLLDSKSTTGSSNFEHTSLTGNTRYYYRARSQADFNGTTVYSEYSNTVYATTLAPSPTITVGAVEEYETLSTVKVKLEVSIPADGNFYQKTIQYSYSLNGGTTWSDWQTDTVISSGDATTRNIEVGGLPTSTEIKFKVGSLTNNGRSVSNIYTLTTPGTHQGPTGFDYVARDYNSSIQTWLSTFSGYSNPIFIQGKSRAEISIPRADAGTTSDGATLIEYKSWISVDGEELTIPFVSGTSEMHGTFPEGTPKNRVTDFPSNNLPIRTRAYDSLGAYTEITKNITTLSYDVPTLDISAETLSTQGSILVNFSGQYSRLQDNSLNSGNDTNSVTLSYRVLDAEGTIIVDWTEISGFSTQINENQPFLKDFSGNATLTNLGGLTSKTVEVRLQDHFETVTKSVSIEIWDIDKIIYPAEYDIEVWDWKTETFLADISYLVAGNLTINWVLNDVEEVEFSVDLEQFEKKCEEMGVDSQTLLAPYVHDLRIRRNGEYILGCQIVETNIRLSNNPPATIQIKATGFLNLFKDQYIMNEAWSGYGYAEIARKLIDLAQKPDCLIKNPTLDIDTSYWLAHEGSIGHYTGGAVNEGGCLGAVRVGTGWIAVGTQMNVDSGEDISISVWVKGKAGDAVYLRERKYLTQPFNQTTVYDGVLTGGWQQIQVASYKTMFENGYILIETNRTDTSTGFFVDECRVYEVSDELALCDMNVGLGVDTASASQSKTRQVNYELQNVKDALIELTQMEEDNFDFEFLPDRTFNVYARKGEDKLDLDISYPGNVDSMTISRSASNLANKVFALGSGIGDERLQIDIFNNSSRQLYGTRESVITSNNVTLKSSLLSSAISNLYDRKNPTDLPKIVIRDGSISPSNVAVGDVIALDTSDSHYIKSIDGEYKIREINLHVTENAVEEMTLTVEPPAQRPEKYKIRYIRDCTSGNSVNDGNHWVQIEALMLVGNEYVNVAQGKTVYTSGTSGSGYTDVSRVTNGNITSEDYYDGGSGTQAVTVDLGDEYPVDYIRIWHYYADNRHYNNEHLSVGNELVDGTTGTTDLEEVLWEYENNTGWIETSDGRQSEWLQQDNIING